MHYRHCNLPQNKISGGINFLIFLLKKKILAFLCTSMFTKKAPFLFFSIFALSAALTASAQKTDSVKKDTIKADTTLLNKYRIEPSKNALPVRVRQVQITPITIPVTLPDYKFSYWHKWTVFNINFNQSGFTSNWTGGGVSNLALNVNYDFKAEYNKSPLDYTTEVNLLYGTSKIQGEGLRKTNDRIFYDNKLATQLSKHWLFFGSLTFESQFDNGYTYQDPLPPLLISKFMSPGYLTESAGVEYKPNKWFDLRLGAATARQTFVLDTSIYHNQTDNYGVTPGHTIFNQIAFQGVATVDKDLMPNLHINVRYALFIPYTQSIAFISHRVDATLTAKVNRLIAVTFNGSLLYDKNTAPQAQGTEGLGLGMIYKFP
jgi:hypothetical protein